MRRHTLALAAFAAGPAFLIATDAPDHTVIVTADRRAEDRERNSASVEVVDALAAERLGQPLTVGDQLLGLPGVDIVGSAGGIDGGTGSIRLRGGRAQDTRIIVDGIPFNDPLSIDGAVNAALLPGVALERIEVVKGAQSGLYGSNAVDGVVQLITLRPTAGYDNRLRLEGGSFSTTRLAGSASGPMTGTLGYALGVDLVNSRGFSAANTPQDPPGSPDHHEADGLRRAQVGGRLEWSPLPAVTWYAAGLAVAVNQAYDDWGDPEDDGSLMRQRLWRGATGGTLKPSRDLTLSVDAAYTASHRVLDGTYSGINTFTLHEQYASAHGTWSPYPLLELTLGGDGTWDQGETDALSASDHALGAWGQAALHGTWADATATLRQDENADAGGATTWRLGGAGFLPHHEAKVHANAGTGFVTPTLDQRYGTYAANPLWQFAQTVGNPGLKPEHSFSRDAGLTLRPLPRIALEADVTAFRTDYRDRIVFLYGDFLTSVPNTYGNLASGRTDGLEASLSLDEAEIPVKVRLAATWQRFDDGLDALQRLLPSRKGRIEAGYAWPQAWLGAHVDAVGRRWGLAGQDQDDLPGYAVAGATARWSFTRNLACYVRGENLGDARYAINPGYTTMPRAFFAGLDARF